MLSKICWFVDRLTVGNRICFGVISYCRHDLYTNQYRAMFVMNCKVVEDEVLRYEPSKQQNSGKKRKKAQKGKLVQHTKEADNMTSVDSTSSEHYHPVTCTECTSEVAVYDSDEVYHFFNVLASHA